MSSIAITVSWSTLGFWRHKKERILAGHHEDILPYPVSARFAKRYPNPQVLLEKVSD